jgi:hypothetical protein
MARQRFSLLLRNTLAQWLKAWAKRLELDTPDAVDKDESAGDGAIAEQADGPPAHWLERVKRHEQPPAHWLAHVQGRSHTRLQAPEPPDIEQPDITPSAKQMPETTLPLAREDKRAAPQSKPPLRLIPHTRPTQEETAEVSKAEEPLAQDKKLSAKKARDKVPESVFPQKRPAEEKQLTTTLRLEPRPATEPTAAPSRETFPESVATFPPVMAQSVEPKQRKELPESKRTAEPDSRPLKAEESTAPIPQPQPQPSPADLWPRPRPILQPQPDQVPGVSPTTRWTNLASQHTQKVAHTPATPVVSPSRPPSLKVERRLPKKTVEEDTSAPMALQPRSVSKGESLARPQEQEEEWDHWPALPAESLGEDVASATAEDWEAQLRAWQRLQKLDREQRGILWNE